MREMVSRIGNLSPGPTKAAPSPPTDSVTEAIVNSAYYGLVGAATGLVGSGLFVTFTAPLLDAERNISKGLMRAAGRTLVSLPAF